MSVGSRNALPPAVVASLVLGARLDLVRSNAIKVWVILLYTSVALAIFLGSGLVDLAVAAVITAAAAAARMAGCLCGRTSTSR